MTTTSCETTTGDAEQPGRDVKTVPYRPRGMQRDNLKSIAKQGQRLKKKIPQKDYKRRKTTTETLKMAKKEEKEKKKKERLKNKHKNMQKRCRIQQLTQSDEKIHEGDSALSSIVH